MNALFRISCFLLLFAHFPVLSAQNSGSGFPVLPGTSINSATELLGNPDLYLGNIWIYGEKGLLLYTDPKTTSIIAVVGSWFPGKGGFADDFFGIRLGSTYPKCIELLGNPISRTSYMPGVDVAVWKKDKWEITLEIWTENAYEPELGGNIYAETVKRIQIVLPYRF